MTKKQDNSAWAEIDLNAIRHNFKALQRLAARQLLPSAGVGSSHILAVIKADAYGHGMLKVAPLLSKLGTDFLGASDVTEGMALRRQGIKKPILLFETMLPTEAKEIIDNRLTPTVCSLAMARALNNYARARKRWVNVHVKVDTGMGRLGIWHEQALQLIRQVMQFPNLTVAGVYTHFPVADTNPTFTKKQMHQLHVLVKELELRARVPYVHAANSMGLVGYKTNFLNLIRPGLMLYGLYPGGRLQRRIKLRPAMSVKARIIFLKDVAKGQGISYGHTFKAKKKMTVATLPIGYSDGYLRCLSNKASVLINGKPCPVVGTVTMDQIMVDVSNIKSPRVGLAATILGKDRNKEVSADELARLAHTINYEIVCSLGNRLPRIYKG